jgi:hypothetical protein
MRAFIFALAAIVPALAIDGAAAADKLLLHRGRSKSMSH